MEKPVSKQPKKASGPEAEENYDKMFKELLKKEILGKVESRISNDDPTILKTIKGLIRDDIDVQNKKISKNLKDAGSKPKPAPKEKEMEF